MKDIQQLIKKNSQEGRYEDMKIFSLRLLFMQGEIESLVKILLCRWYRGISLI